MFTVGEGGRVHSFERKKSHLLVAQKNYQQWMHSVRAIHGNNGWSDNVMFCLTDLSEADGLLKPGSVDAVSQCNFFSISCNSNAHTHTHTHTHTNTHTHTYVYRYVWMYKDQVKFWKLQNVF